MKLTTALLATTGLAAAAPTGFPPKPIDTPFDLPGELEEPGEFHGPANIHRVEPVGVPSTNPTPVYDPEPLIPENATLEEVKEYTRQWADNKRLHDEPIDWDDFHASFPHGQPPYWNRFPFAKRADAPAPEDPMFPAKMTDEELKESIQPKDDNGKPYHLWDDRYPWITRFGKRAEAVDPPPPGFPPKLTVEELLELFRPSDEDGEPSHLWVPEKRAEPQPLLDFLKANPHMRVMSVKPIAKRTDGPEDYDLTEEDLERDMCHVTLWDAMSGQWPEKVWECYEWHHLEDDGWNAGAWELD